MSFTGTGIKKPMIKDGNIKVITPKGLAEWAKVFTPDTKYVPAGEYSVTVVISKEESEELKAQIDSVVDAEHAKQIEEIKAKKQFKGVKKAYPYTEEYDSEGNLTGNLKFKFKMKKSVTMKDGTTFDQKPQVFDAQNNPSSEEIWNGSVIKVAGEVIPYYTSTVGAGATLRLKAVQVIELKTKTSSGASGNTFGFAKEEGYVASKETSNQTLVPLTDEEEAEFFGDNSVF